MAHADCICGILGEGEYQCHGFKGKQHISRCDRDTFRLQGLKENRKQIHGIEIPKKMKLGYEKLGVFADNCFTLAICVIQKPQTDAVDHIGFLNVFLFQAGSNKFINSFSEGHKTVAIALKINRRKNVLKRKKEIGIYILLI